MRKHHGMRFTKTYASWASMKDRCVRSKNYIERGITICVRWLDFNNFLADMGERPEGTTLDRIDPLGNYEPSNCRWADKTTQARNIPLRRANKTGIHGVWWYAERKSYKACISIKNEFKHLGYTTDFFEACCLRKSAENKFYQPTLK